ncbi:hypothetical protein [Serratia liquefaciens]|uniref:hypothetical protein n=1 Tax=Serratia liquefaciens TaxID=614 RepID=UPI0022B970D3|nr:hypothetical protein [Serratia liquefaciens]
MEDIKYSNLLELAESQAVQIAALQNIVIGLYATTSQEQKSEVRKVIDGVYKMSISSGDSDASTERVFAYTNAILASLPE